MRFLTIVGLGLAVAAVLASASRAHAQGGWTDSGTNVRLTTGSDRVGIGTTAPAAKLHVIGSTRVDGTLSTNVITSRPDADLRLRVGSVNALRLEPTAGVPNIIGGSGSNAAHPGVVGATIGGGGGNAPFDNVVTDDFGTVGGGRGNRAGDAAGPTDQFTGATVGGGIDNVARGAQATVAGGGLNSAIGNLTAVGGGEDNVAIGHRSTVGGGFSNTASGDDSTVPGGTGNTASGNFSFAAGRSATAGHDGAFVWADSNTPFDFASETNNQFRVRSTGGAAFVSAIDTTGGATAGVTLAAGGSSWASMSDRNVKDNITPLDGRQILRRLRDIPITQWNLKAQDPAIKHVGPMAQDFYAAFGLGENERYINSADADGVALVSIQALYEMVTALEQKTASLERLAQSVEELRARLTRFEQAAQMPR
jgi:hypothetical protein